MFPLKPDYCKSANVANLLPLPVPVSDTDPDIGEDALGKRDHPRFDGQVCVEISRQQLQRRAGVRLRGSVGVRGEGDVPLRATRGRSGEEMERGERRALFLCSCGCG